MVPAQVTRAAARTVRKMRLLGRGIRDAPSSLRVTPDVVRRAFSDEAFETRLLRGAGVVPTVARPPRRCGGLCPGLNTVVKNLVEILGTRYGVEKVYGIRGGYRGFTAVGWDAPLELDAAAVGDVHREGGTVLGTSRGGFDAEKIVDWLKAKRVNQLYVVARPRGEPGRGPASRRRNFGEDGSRPRRGCHVDIFRGERRRRGRVERTVGDETRGRMGEGRVGQRDERRRRVTRIF